MPEPYSFCGLDSWVQTLRMHLNLQSFPALQHIRWIGKALTSGDSGGHLHLQAARSGSEVANTSMLVFNLSIDESMVTCGLK